MAEFGGGGISRQHRLQDGCVSGTEGSEAVAWPEVFSEDLAPIASSDHVIVRASDAMEVLLLLMLFPEAATATSASAKTWL